ncbi:MAG: hypothetical protein EBR48_05950 [bacterium]|nr:hypothetical protein [Candidatus Aquidulcis frankliniae]
MMTEKGRNDLHGQILTSIEQRSPWELRQTRWYELRHHGLRRTNKPWPKAADLHWPLIDTAIEKLKPLFLQQALGMDVVASFIPMRQQLNAYTKVAEDWFNYKIREKTNFVDEVLSWVDYTLMSGRGVMKCIWNPGSKRVDFEAVDPMYFVVPPYTVDLQDADWAVHVMPMSVGAYKRMAAQMGWKADSKTISKIRGNPQEDDNIPGAATEDDAKQLREGITYTSNTDGVIIWEVYRKRDDGVWEVYLYSPAAVDMDLRDPMELAYDHGQLPFVDFPYEIKDKGWFSPRGVCEILAPFELSMTSMWNHKHDAMTLYNRPLFRAERELPNSINLRFQPGQILPYGVAPVQMPQPPVSFDQELNQTRAVAENRIGSPDYGMASVMSGGSDRRTATEIQSINAQAMQSGDLRARLFRMSLGKLYRQAWGLYVQYDSKSLRYRFAEDSLQADPVALHDQYELEPKGGMDMVSRQMMIQQAINRKQLFMQSPWVDQVELDKSIMELDDPSLVKRLLRDPGQKAADELEDETKTIPTLLVGIPVPAKPGQNFAGRIGVLVQYLNGAMQQGQQLSPAGKNAFMQRIDSLLQGYEQVATNEARKLRKEIQKFFESTGLLAAQPPAPVAEQAPMM